MKINGNAIRPGNVIEYRDSLWRAVKIQHTQPGKGGAYLQVELRNLLTGSKLNERFRSSENVERVRLEEKSYQFLYRDDNHLNFMDTETFDQISMDASLLGDALAFLQDGMEVIIESHEERPVSVRLPETVILEVVETEPVVKGQTAASSNKPAVLENGVRVMVPPFVDVGTKVVVNTDDGSYARRAES